MVWVVDWKWTYKIPANRTFNVERMSSRIAEKGRKITAKHRKNQRRAFTYGGHQRHGGRRWRKLRPATIERKGHARPLIRSGHMRRRQSTLGMARLSGRKVYVNIRMRNNAPYSNYHQFGFVHRGAGFIRPRPPVSLTGADKKEIKETIKRMFPPPRKRRRKRRRR